MPDTTTLRLLRDIINEAICQEEGHTYDDFKLENTGVGTNTLRYERCSRCGDTRSKFMDSTTSSNLSIDSVTATRGD